MRKFKFSLFVMILLLLCLVACGRSNGQQTESEPPESVTTAVLIPPEELAYSGILCYEYAEEAGYYSCLYVTYDTATVWHSTVPPDVQTPTASDGFDGAYTEAIDPALYINAVQIAVENEFEKLDAAVFADELEFERNMQSSSAFYPETHIAVYNTQGLVLELGLLDEDPLQDPKDAFVKLHTALSNLHAHLDLTSGTQTAQAQPKLVAVLNMLSANGYDAEYRTADRIVTWSCSDIFYQFNYDDPLQSEGRENIKEYAVNGLIDVPSIDRLPFRTQNESKFSVDDAGRQTVVLYYDDGTRTVVSRFCPSAEWHPIWV